MISGEREAGLSFLGERTGSILSTAPPPYLVLDIGGGSTELVVGAEPGRAEHAISTRMGSVRLTERFVRHDPPLPDEVAQLEIAVDEVLDDAEAHVPVRDARTLIAVAGTATTLQAIALGLDRYDPEAIHRTWLPLAIAQGVLDDLIRMTTPERAALPIMAPGRGDVIVAGGVILTTVMRRFGFERALVSETDILDGLAYECWTSDRLVARMSKRSRDRHLAKLSARRQAERDAQRRRRQRTLRIVGGVAGVVVLVTAGSVLFNGGDSTQASPSPTVSPSASRARAPRRRASRERRPARSIRSRRRPRSRAARRRRRGRASPSRSSPVRRP